MKKEMFVLVIAFPPTAIEVEALLADIAEFASVGEVDYSAHDRVVKVCSDKVAPKRMTALIGNSIASYGLAQHVRFWSYELL